MSDFELIYFKRPYDWLYLVYDAPDWLQELYFEGCHRRESQHLFLFKWHSLEVFALPQRDKAGFYAPAPGSWWWCESQKALGGADPIVLIYLLDLYR